MRTVFIDESGDLGQKGTSFFILAAVVTDNAQLLRREMRKIKDLLPAKKRPGEIHWHSCDDLMRARVLKRLARLNLDIHLVIIDKRTAVTNEDSYQHMAELLIRQIRGELVVIFDSRTGGRDRRVASFLCSCFPALKLLHLPSHEDKGLQAADMVASAAHAKYTYGNPMFDYLSESIHTEMLLKKSAGTRHSP